MHGACTMCALLSAFVWSVDYFSILSRHQKDSIDWIWNINKNILKPLQYHVMNIERYREVYYITLSCMQSKSNFAWGSLLKAFGLIFSPKLLRKSKKLMGEWKQQNKILPPTFINPVYRYPTWLANLYCKTQSRGICGQGTRFRAYIVSIVTCRFLTLRF